MPRKVNQLRLDRWAAEQATEAARVWIQPALDLLAKAKAERWPLPKLKEEVARLELDSGTLANSMVSAMQIGMGLGIIDGDMRPKRKRTRSADSGTPRR